MPGKVDGRFATGRSSEGRLSGSRSAASRPPGRLGRASAAPPGRSGRLGRGLPAAPGPVGLGRISGIVGRVAGFCTEGLWISGRLISGRGAGFGFGRDGTLGCGRAAGLGSGLAAGRFTGDPVMGLRLGAWIWGRAAPPPPRIPPPPPPRRSRAPAPGFTRASPRSKERNKAGFFILVRESEGFSWWKVRVPDGRCGVGCRAGLPHRRHGGSRSRGGCWALRW